ncbi:MAG: hypothetical protein Q8R18_03340 [bacterium]|nr:hypothetical protein [bacterium]
MKSLKDLIKGQQPIGEALRDFRAQDLNMEDLLEGRLSREEITKTLGPSLDLAAFGTGELGGRIIVIEPPDTLVDGKGRPVRLYYVIGGETLTINGEPGDRPFYKRKDMEAILPLDLTEITIDTSGQPQIQRKTKETEKRNPNTPEKLKEGKATTKRRTTQFDALLYSYLLKNGDDIAHLVNGLEEIPKTKQAISGEAALREHFPEADALLAFGVTKVHSLESWLQEMVQERISNLKRDIKEFYTTTEGKEFVREFMNQEFPQTYDHAPEVMKWIINYGIEGRQPQFLLSAIGAGILGEEKEKKQVYRFWGRVAKATREAASNTVLIEKGYLEGKHNIDDIYIPLLRELRNRRGIYSGSTVEASLFGLFGLGLLLDSKGEVINAHSLNRTYTETGRYIINNYPTIKILIDEMVKDEELRKKYSSSKTTSGLIQRAILNEESLRERLTMTKAEKGEMKTVPISEALLNFVIPAYLRVEIDRYKPCMTLETDAHFLRNTMSE